MQRLLGIDPDAARVRASSSHSASGSTARSSDLEVIVPLHRLDVTAAADVAEEVARAHGYERIEGRLPHAALPPFRADPSGPRMALRRILAGLGVDEMVGHALIGADDLARTGHEPIGDHLVRVYNPLSEEHAILRPTLAPSLLAGVAENARRRRRTRGCTTWQGVLAARRHVPRRGSAARKPREPAATSHGSLGSSWPAAAVPAGPGEPARVADVGTLKGLVDAVHDAIGAERPTYRAEEPDGRHPHRHPGRTGLICDAAGRPYGSLGEVHPRVVEAWGLAGRPVDAAIDVDRLLGLVPDRIDARTPSAAQPVDRDLAVVVDEATPVGELLRVARMSAGPMLDELRLFDVYRGEQIGPGRVSYALAFRFQPDATGDEKTVDKALNKVRGSLRHHLGAEIR